MKSRNQQSAAPPQPHIPGLTREMVMEHAARLFRDLLPARPLTEREWRIAEKDLARKLERKGW